MNAMKLKVPSSLAYFKTRACRKVTVKPEMFTHHGMKSFIEYVFDVQGRPQRNLSKDY